MRRDSVLPAPAPQCAAAGAPELVIAPAPAAAPLAQETLEALPAPQATPGADVISGERRGGRKNDGRNADNVVGGGEDRMRHLAMAPGGPAPPLRTGSAGREHAITPVRALSRIECMRRCGSDGFCDPSSASGCGGEYCLAGRDLV
ncbi:hypothetical protein IV454_18890 [Massilia antarctica]|uniref:Uncharacterized protein n=1 Tax=Massilia antarctica TaxID=2765360 RepID=A0AA48W6Z0_9BURK|nr:hypothetical protein [Massilia antarctica]QPI47652.1 hypothetical protein IV454_18890 [Massilia antarctica]